MKMNAMTVSMSTITCGPMIYDLNEFDCFYTQNRHILSISCSKTA